MSDVQQRIDDLVKGNRVVLVYPVDKWVLMLLKAGAQVRVSAQGPGYAVTSAGQALSAGSVGQTVRVRMDNGRIVSGIVSEDGTVTITL